MQGKIELDLKDRYRGSLVGLAVGDALGTTLEFKTPGTFEPINDMVGAGPFRLASGKWTDDTSMALCLAESLVQTGGFDPEDQMRRYLRWYREGYLSSTGECFDIGNTVRGALERFEQTDDPFAGSQDPRAAGNGSLMRLAPVPLAYSGDPEKAIRLSGEMSRTTHAAVEAVDACRYYGGVIIGALYGVDKEILLSPRYTPVEPCSEAFPLVSSIDSIATGTYKTEQPPKIRGTGYVVRSLEAALWAFWNSGSFAEGALLAVNLGDDADTTGAIYGQLAGAYYGVNSIPERWRDKVSHPELITSLADGLLATAQRFSRQQEPTSDGLNRVP